jgi:hypothetical protein
MVRVGLLRHAEEILSLNATGSNGYLLLHKASHFTTLLLKSVLEARNLTTYVPHMSVIHLDGLLSPHASPTIGMDFPLVMTVPFPPAVELMEV